MQFAIRLLNPQMFILSSLLIAFISIFIAIIFFHQPIDAHWILEALLNLYFGTFKIYLSRISYQIVVINTDISEIIKLNK